MPTQFPTLVSRRKLIILFGVILVFKLAFLVVVQNNPFVSTTTNDEAYWIAEANDILDHGVIRNDAFWGAPAYPYMLALLFTVFGHGIQPVLILQAVMGALNIILVILLAERALESRRAAWIAGGLTLLFGPLWMYETLVLKSTMAVMFSNLAMLVLFVTLGKSRRSWWFLSGMIFGLLPLLRGNVLLVLPFVFLGLALEIRHRRVDAARLGIWLLGVACGVLPATVHNAIAAFDFVPTTYQGGTMFFIGNRAGADGSYASLRPGRGHPKQEQYDAITMAETAVGQSLLPSQISAFWFHRGLTEIAKDPGSWLRLMLRKLWLFHADAENTDVVDFRVYREVTPLLWLTPLSFGFFLALAVPGLLLGRHLPDMKLIALMIVGSVVSVVVFFVFTRYRLPAVTLYILLAAVTIDHIIGWIGVRRWKAIAATVAVTVAIFCLTRIPTPKSNPAMGFNTLGCLYARLGNLQMARLYLERVVRELPDRGEMRFNLGNVLKRQGESCAAAEQFRIAGRDPRMERLAVIDPIVRLQLYEITDAWVLATEDCSGFAPPYMEALNLRRKRAQEVLAAARSGEISLAPDLIHRLSEAATKSHESRGTAD